jgi:tetratricopeptide (TPR) repeat protein
MYDSGFPAKSMEWAMHFRVAKCPSLALVSIFSFLLAAAVCEARPAPLPQGTDHNSNLTVELGEMNRADVDIYIKGPDGTAIPGTFIVTLTKLTGVFYNQLTGKSGYIRFNAVPTDEYIAQVVAPGYLVATKQFEIPDPTLVKVTIEVKPNTDVEDVAATNAIFALPPKTQREVGKALQALRSNKLNDARKHLDAAQKDSPTSAEVEYLFGVYASQANEPMQAKSYWVKTLELNPTHLSALLEVAFELLHEGKPVDAQPYLIRAVEVSPSSWRAQALLAEALVLQHKDDEAIQHAQRALDLGHDRASSAQLVLVRAMIEKGQKDEALQVLKAYVKSYPADKDSAKYLDRLEHPQPGESANDAASAANEMAAAAREATALPVPSNWLPPDVDATVPPVIAGTACDVKDVVDKAGKQIMELVHDVDRFTATESLTHVSIDKYGMPSAPEKRKFNYVASIQEVRRGYLNVEEYRNSNGLPAQFPDGVATNGLPALVLIFHPYNAGDFDMTCEGLARRSGGLAWQVHFKQRPDKPNVIRTYRIGADGPSYPVALKGRAWISADTYQIVRLETDLVAPIAQIRLAADRADIEYGPVKFAKGNISMWLPKSADVYYDWMGRRIHRRHSFSNYMLFAVDDKQNISKPKTDNTTGDTSPDGGSGAAPKQKR